MSDDSGRAAGSADPAAGARAPAETPVATATAVTTAAASGPPPLPRRWRSRRALLALMLLAPLGCDLAQPPRRQVSAWMLLGAIHLYQATLSPHMRALGVECRFKPTCSHYGAGAIERYGALSGSLRTVWRLARCGPWTPLGTYDPP